MQTAYREQAAIPDTLGANRWTVSKSPCGKWVVEDTHSPRAEDPVLYRFSSQRKARDFVAMLVAEAK